MRASYSRVSTWLQCPRKYRYRYVDEVETDRDTDPQSPLLTGTMLHRAVETDVETAVREYYDQVPIASDASEEEAIRIAYLAPKVSEVLPYGESEVRVSVDVPVPFVGFIDRLGNDGSIWDLKYSNHPERYTGDQLQLYGYMMEQSTGKAPTSLHYLIVPRINIRLSKRETVPEFRDRLRSMLSEASPKVIDVEYSREKAGEVIENARLMLADTEYPKRESRLCEWCDYKQFCQGEDTMMLPENEKRKVVKTCKKKIWLYGAPFSGKTHVADEFPNALMLNTDGNINFVTSPYIAIRDEVTVEGRITKRKLAWDVFKETIEELEKKQNSYETIVVDLVEDLYEHCRLWSYQKLGIEHESDNSFKAYDFVRTQFLSTMKRLINLGYQNIVLLSQEDTTRDITRRTGDKTTTIKPNIQDKVALKLAGMVDLVGRVVSEDGEHTIHFKTSETVFGGGRIPVRVDSIPSTYEAICKVYEDGGVSPSTDRRKSA